MAVWKKETDVKQSMVTTQWQNCTLYIIRCRKTFFENLTFIKNNYITSYLKIHNIYIFEKFQYIISGFCEFRILELKDLVNSSCNQRVHKFYQNCVE